MHKYQKKGLCKALSIILAVAMLFTSPIGITQAYAFEDGQPAVEGSQEDLPLGASEGAELNDVLDSGVPLEEPSPPADSDAPEATPSDAEETGLEHNPATPSDASEMQSRATLYRSSDIFVVATDEDLRGVLSNLVDGDVIRLADNIDYTTNLAVGISTRVTFDLGNYTLNITNTQNDGAGLIVGSGGDVGQQGFAGKLNVSGGSYGMQVVGGPEFAQAMVTNATARNAGGSGISAVGNANAVALGDVSSYGAGAHASGIESTVLVHGEISARTFGAHSIAGGKITAKKGVTQIGEEGTGAYISGSEVGSIMIGGEIQAKDYIRFDDTFMTRGDGVADPGEPGYIKYTSGNRVVWVKDMIMSDDKVCEIDGIKYTTLDAGLTAVQSGETIKLLKDINYDKGIVIDGKTVTFDVGGFTLNATSDTGAALEVKNAGKVQLFGTGSFNVRSTDFSQSGHGVAVYADSMAVVTSAAKRDNSWASCAYAEGAGAQITVLGNITAQGGKVATAKDGGQITIEGAVTASGNCIGINAGGYQLSWGKSDSAKPGYLKYSDIGTAVIWIKDATAPSDKVCEINGKQYATLTEALAAVKTNETIKLLKDINYNEGIIIDGKTITFDVGSFTLNVTSTTSSHGIGLEVKNGGNVNLNGSGEFNVTHTSTSGESIGLLVRGDSTATVTNVKAVAGAGSGVYANGNGAIIYVLGNVEATGSSIYGARTWGTVEITIHGSLTAKYYANIGGASKNKADGEIDPFYSGYLKYSDSAKPGALWVKDEKPSVTVDSVTVSPTTANVQKGKSQQFTATVTGTNNPAQTVTWSVTGGMAGTSISNSGLLTVAAGETTSGLTVAATSTVDTSKKGSATVTVVSTPMQKYQLTVTNGSGTGEYEAGVIVSVTANQLDPGKRFKAWTATGLTGLALTANPLRFTMPSTAVTLTATYEDIPSGTVPTTGVSLSKSTLSLYSNTAPNTGTLAATVTPSDATNKTVTWASGNTAVVTMDQNGYVRAVGNGTAVITATTVDGGYTASCTVTVTTYSGSGGGNGGGGYIPPTVTTPIVTEKQPDMPTTANLTVSGTVKEGVLSATITEQMAKDAIKAAQDVVKKSGKELDGIALDFNVTESGSYTNLNATIDAAAIDHLKESGVKFVKIGSSVLDITFDTDAIAEIDRQSTGTVTVSATRLTKLSDAAKKLIGNRPVFDITVSYQKNGKTEYVSNFGKGAVTLGIAYKATVKESKGNLFGIYVDNDGKPKLLTNSRYDNTGRLIFSRNSLSTYGVGYKAPALAFTDTAKHWAKDNIDFVASRDLISGASATTFAPNTDITRADFLMALGRLSGTDVSGYKVSSFSDVKATDTAMPYIEWAVKNKIVSGYGNDKFGPNDSITREQMAVMMVNYAKATGYKLHVSIAAVTFADNAKISAYAKDAVKAIQQTGVINGKYNNSFDPHGNTTRAETATILRRFVELVIDEGTAPGWVQNDAGYWQWIGEMANLPSGGSRTRMESIIITSPRMASWFQASGWRLTASGTTSMPTALLPRIPKLTAMK